MKRLIVLLTFILALAAGTVHAADSVLIVVTSHSQMGDTDKRTGFWLAEMTHPYYVIKDAGYDVVVASIDGGVAPIDPRSMDTADPVNQRFLRDADLMAAVLNSRKLADIDPNHFAAVLFSGGHGTMWDFPGDSAVNRFTSTVYEDGGVVGAVCHGPAALAEVKLSDGSYLIDGKRFAAFTNEEERKVELDTVVPFMLQDRLTERGGIHVPADAWQTNAVIDQRVVTGQNPQSAHKVGELIVKALKSMEANN
ncbi:MAG: type 1 glutamine amidotransferase domain-containing protein [candidate division Zixibacteria bacterium]|nr:type 1 glutamine amidotransferase domain-containing protein [candidate division Zixibacteria bacterium]